MISLALILGLLGCGDDDASVDGGLEDGGADTSVSEDASQEDASEEDASEDAEAQARTLEMEFTGLPALGTGYEYEGWIIVDGSPITAGRFSVDAEGNLDPATVEIPAEQAEAAAMYVLTIEPIEGDDPAPSDTHVLAGPFDGASADLTIGHEAALGDDFTAAAGTFILATPTSAAEDDDNQGIWFLAPGEPMTASLDLPELPAGWVYEGWVVDTSGEAPAPISTGTFTAVDAADSNGAGEAAGEGGAPPFPGEDFIDPARDLTTSHMAVISIEPSPDDSPAPFQLKPLATPISDAVGGANPQTINNAIGENGISGTVRWQ